jgi:hypothetical protein
MPKNVFSGVGISNNQNPLEAGKEAAEKAINGLEGHKPTFAFVFVGSNYDLKKLNQSIKKVLGNCQYVGCTTCGEISTYGFSRHSCTVLAISSEYIKFGVGIAKGVLKNPEKATEAAINQSLKSIKIDKYVDPYISFVAMKTKKPSELVKMKPYCTMIFTPGLGPISVNNDAIISTLNKIIGRYIPVIGAGAASDEIFVNKFMFVNGEVYDDAIITLFIVSDVKVGFGLAHGFKPMNTSAYITKMKGLEILEINNKNSVEVYKGITGVDLSKWALTPQSLGSKEAVSFLRHPFALQTLSGNYIMRHVLAEKPQKSLRFCFSVPKNAPLVPMEGDLNEIANAGGESIKKAIQDAGSEDVVAAITFSCLLRQMAQGKNIEKEISKVNKAIKNKPMNGFYCVGEISFFEDSPITSQQESIVTMVITDTLLSDGKI